MLTEKTMNKVILIGNLGKDGELRYLPDGTPAVNFSLATSRKWKNKEGELQEEVEWHAISMLGTRASSLAEYLTKGTKIAVDGRLRYRKWTDKEGVSRVMTEIVAQDVELLGGGKQEAGHSAPRQEKADTPKSAASASSGFDDSFDDDIPF
jgi:single-strand DNA-binding protein